MWPEGRIIRPYDGGEGEAVKSGGTGFWDLGFDTDEDDRQASERQTLVKMMMNSS